MKYDIEKIRNTIIQGHVLDELKKIPSNTIDTIITSPPYWGLRDYGEQTKVIWDGMQGCKHEWKEGTLPDECWGKPGKGKHNIKGKRNYSHRGEQKYSFCSKCGAWYGQLGLEPTLDLFIKHLLQITSELKRVLKPTGVMFWNHCLDKNTRLLTQKGYKFYWELSDNEIIPTLDLKQNKVEWKQINQIIIGKNKLLKLHERRFNMALTSKHKAIVRSFVAGKLRKERIINVLKNKRFKIPICSLSGNEEYSIEDNWLKLLGWFLTDGTLHKKGNFLSVGIYQSKKEGQQEIKKILKVLNLKFSIYKDRRGNYSPTWQFYIHTSDSKILLNKFNIWSKKLPSLLNKISDRQFKIFLDAVIAGDGSIKKHSGWRDSIMIAGKEKFLKNLMGYCVVHNVACSLNSNKRGDWSLQLRNAKNWWCQSKNIEKSKGEENTWCVNVDNHTIFVERNGCPFITGNSDCYGGSGMGTWKNPPEDYKSKEVYHIPYRSNVEARKKRIMAKCLMLQNYRLILKMVDEQGFILRNSICWFKPNSMPSSVKDRFSNAYEPVFMLVKNKRYWFDLDAVRIPHKYPEDVARRIRQDKEDGIQPFAKDNKEGIPWRRDLKTEYKEEYKKEWKRLKKEAYGNDDKGARRSRVMAGLHKPAKYGGKWKDDQEYMNKMQQRINDARAAGKPHDEALSHPAGKNPADVWKPYAVQERIKDWIEVRDLPEIEEIKDYLNLWRKKKKLTIEYIEEKLNSQASHHWFNGESYPTKEDWIRIKKLLGFDNKYDREMTETHLKPAEKQNDPKGKNPGDLWEICTQPFPEAHFACADSKTEALTWEGWKRVNELTIDDRFATFDYLNEKIIYHKPYKIFKYNYNGKLITIDNRWISQHVTPNHRILLKHIHSTRKKYSDQIWHFIEAQNLRPFSGILIPNSGCYEGEIRIGQKEAELLGWIITEGCISQNRGMTIYQSNSANPDKVERIEWLLKKLNIDYTRRDRKRKKSIIKDKKYISHEVSFYIKKRGKNWQWIFDWIDEDKRPRWKLLHLCQQDLKALYRGIILGDGNYRKDSRESLTQKDDYIRLWFRTLCVHLGERTTEFNNPRRRSAGTVFVTHQNYSQIHTSDYKECVKEKKYKGIVWCPYLPNGTWISKRNGKISISGNTFPQKLVEPMVKSSCPKEICKKCGKARERISKVSYTPINQLPKNHPRYRPHSKHKSKYTTPGLKEGKMKTENMRLGHAEKETQTIGWTDCKCKVEGKKYRSGIVLDPFMGSGTVAKVARFLGRDFIGIEINSDYIKIANKRLAQQSLGI